MALSLSTAAKETGVSKSTLSRAIKGGRLSAVRGDDGSYRIEPAELFRVYPRAATQPTSDERHDAPRNPIEEAHATPSPELELLRVKLAMTEAMLAREQETVADLRKRLDAEAEQVLCLSKAAQSPNDRAHDASRNPAQRVLTWWRGGSPRSRS